MSNLHRSLNNQSASLFPLSDCSSFSCGLNVVESDDESFDQHWTHHRFATRFVGTYFWEHIYPTLQTNLVLHWTESKFWYLCPDRTLPVSGRGDAAPIHWLFHSHLRVPIAQLLQFSYPKRICCCSRTRSQWIQIWVRRSWHFWLLHCYCKQNEYN